MIPIVFSVGDAVERGLVAGFAWPGGNLTGVSLMNVELMPKRLELLSELVPQASVIALLVNPTMRIPSVSSEMWRKRRTRRACSSRL